MDYDAYQMLVAFSTLQCFLDFGGKFTD